MESSFRSSALPYFWASLVIFPLGLPRSQFLACSPDGSSITARMRRLASTHRRIGAARLATTPSTELARRRDELRSLARNERETGRRRAEISRLVESEENFLARIPAQHERAAQLPRRARRVERERIEQAAARAEARRYELLSEAATLAPPSEDAQHELAAVDRVLEERRDVAVIAARLSAPRYLTEELGERPADAEGARLWDRAAGEIERYRQEHGITDPDNALGIKPSDPHGLDSWRDETRSARRAQEHLHHQQAELHLAHESIDRGLDIGL